MTVLLLRRGAALIGAIGVGVWYSGAATAFEKFEMRVLGGFGNQQQIEEVERPFFTKVLPEASGGKIGVTYRTIDEVGLKGFEGMRLLKLGIFDVMEINLGYVGGDEPFFLGLDMIGAAPDLDTAWKLTESYRPYFDQRLHEKSEGKLLTLWPFTAQSIFCNGEINGLSDLKGKKIRIFSPALANLMKSFGAVGVTMAYPEVYQALQRGVLDCAVTGTTAGNAAKWPEVTTHFYGLPLAWAMQAHVANRNFWQKLAPDAQQFLTEQFKKNVERVLWKMAADTTQDGINCNTSTGPCKTGKEYQMKLVKVTPEDIKLLQKAVTDKVLPDWIADCRKSYPQCADVWNKTGGMITGMMAK